MVEWANLCVAGAPTGKFNPFLPTCRQAIAQGGDSPAEACFQLPRFSSNSSHSSSIAARVSRASAEAIMMRSKPFGSRA